MILWSLSFLLLCTIDPLPGHVFRQLPDANDFSFFLKTLAVVSGIDAMT
jgi:hypothetical protein